MDRAGVVFDMDGVLVDTYQAHFRSWQQVAAERELPFSEEAFRKTFGKTSREIIAELWGKDRFDDTEIEEMDRRKEAAFRRLIENDFPAMPGVMDLLDDLRAAGVRLAVGSSGPPDNVDFVVDRLQARGLFDAIVTGKDVRRGKPDPQVFLMAADRLGIEPSRCVVVEDAPVGIAAARAGGMASIGMVSTGRSREDLQQADAIVQSLAEITPEMVRDLIQRPSHAG